MKKKIKRETREKNEKESQNIFLMKDRQTREKNEKERKKSCNER